MAETIKQIQLPSGTYLLVEVPEGFFKHEIISGSAGDNRVKTSDRVGDEAYSDALPSGNWQIVGKANRLTEGQWNKIVERVKDLKDQPHKGYLPGKLTVCWNAIQSGLSLIASHNMKSSECLILKLNQP